MFSEPLRFYMQIYPRPDPPRTGHQVGGQTDARLFANSRRHASGVDLPCRLDGDEGKGG